VGRTGSGKTALLLHLGDVEDNVAQIEPEGLSLQYLSGSNILRHLQALGVNLGLFYKLLWRHVFAVELIKAKYGMRTESQNKTYVQILLDLVQRDKAKEKAINYLVEWGESFWKDTEYRIREVTAKLETEVKSSLGVKLAPLLEASASAGQKMSVEQKSEIHHFAQEAVNKIQLNMLGSVIKLLAESVFQTPQPRFYLVIDKLDENWVDDDHIRYSLIKALIEAIKELNHALKSVKIVIALRRDLLDRVIQETRETGFQEEKYHPLYLSLQWNQEQMFGLLDRRVDKLIRRQYTQEQVYWTDIMPAKINKKASAEYLSDRTLYRPRDLIVFFNACMALAVDKPEITARMVLQAEGEYSQRRLRSLYDEWRAEHPELAVCAELLKKRPGRFVLDEIGENILTEKCLALAISTEERGVISRWATEVIEGRSQTGEFRARLAAVFYKVGLVGLKLDPQLSESWSFRHSQTVSTAEVRDGCLVLICPMFYRALGVPLDLEDS
jgi:hypothetical protein